MSDVPPPLPPAIDVGRTGPAWEQPGPTFSRFLDTMREVLFNPVVFFRTMRRSGGLGPPLVFGIAGTLIGGIIGALYQFMMMSMSGSLGDMEGRSGELAAMLFSTGCIVVFVPVIAVLSLFIAAGIYHVMLLLLGGARFPFETTMRVVAYSMGATSVLQIVPICGGLAAAVWAIVATIIGLAHTHEIPVGKAAAAVLLPVVICCVLVAAFYVLAFAALFGAIAGGWEA